MYYSSIVDVCFDAVGLECDSYCFRLDGKITAHPMDKVGKMFATSISFSSPPQRDDGEKAQGPLAREAVKRFRHGRNGTARIKDSRRATCRPVAPCLKGKATRRISTETRIWYGSAKDDDRGCGELSAYRAD